MRVPETGRTEVTIRTKPRRAVLLGVTGMTLILAACGSSKASSPSTTTEPQHTATTGTPPTTPTTSVPPTTAPAPVHTAGAMCQNGQIGVSTAAGGVGLSHISQLLLFTNTSQTACTLSGYPGVAALNGQGAQVEQAQRQPGGYLGGLQNQSTIIPTVTVSPGGSVSAMVEGIDGPIGAATSCPYFPAFLVTPPGLTRSFNVPVPTVGGAASGFPGCAPLQVHPVVPSTTGSG
jgi:hypothetical protein